MSPPRRRTALRALGKVVYWLAVLAISFALLIALVLFFESRDDSSLTTGAASHLLALD